ncbi:hypothetical protein [Williamsia sterculiae]|uniref:hypothetical protein n=1 Tax=Williamsia sterculiae TaxID=1344003 RepID=UPI0009FA3A85|nr:hypothetical protein [Williamsia sterculiae]
MGKKDKAAPCPRGYVRLDAIEAGISRFYARLALTEDEVEQIRAAIHVELADRQAQAEWDKTTASKAIARLEHQREELLAAHYGAIPLPLLKTDMARITNELMAAEKSLAATARATTDIQQLDDNALQLAAHCTQLYDSGTPHGTSPAQPGFFTRIYLEEDGLVASAELQEPFVHLLAQHETTQIIAAATEAPRSAR